jgi:hypothetical protein
MSNKWQLRLLCTLNAEKACTLGIANRGMDAHSNNYFWFLSEIRSDILTHKRGAIRRLNKMQQYPHRKEHYSDQLRLKRVMSASTDVSNDLTRRKSKQKRGNWIWQNKHETRFWSWGQHSSSADGFWKKVLVLENRTQMPKKQVHTCVKYAC